MTSCLKACLGLLLGLLSLTAGAQNWYQVELILFAQDHPDLYSPGATRESWPENLQPQWPAPLVRLGDDASPSPALRPLPTGERQMNNDAYALRVTEGYRLLWHQAWLQPMLDEQNSPWIKIQGGEAYGDRFELEGAVRVHLERFLHLTTDLWLSEFDAAERSPEPQPEEPAFSLPAVTMPPSACPYFSENWPTNLAMEQPDMEPDQVVDDWWFPPFDCGIANLDTGAGMPLGSAADPYVRLSLPTASYQLLSPAGGSLGGRRINRPLFIDNSSSPPGESANPAWQVSQIIPVRQSRRMRSAELHYLDHPRLGVLVLISPVDAPVINRQDWLDQQ